MKYLVLLAFVLIIGSLGVALVFMMKNSGEDASWGKKMARALTVRIGLSVALFVAILLAWKLGYIHPTGIPAGR